MKKNNVQERQDRKDKRNNDVKNNMRTYRARVKKKNEARDVQIEELQKGNAALKQEVMLLKQEVMSLKQEVMSLKQQIEELQKENAALKQENDLLKREKPEWRVNQTDLQKSFVDAQSFRRRACKESFHSDTLNKDIVSDQTVVDPCNQISMMSDSDQTSVDITFQKLSKTLDKISVQPDLDQKLLIVYQQRPKMLDSLTLDELSKLKISSREHLETVKQQEKALQMDMVKICMQLDESVENCRFKTMINLQRDKLIIRIISSEIEIHLLEKLSHNNFKNLMDMIAKDTGIVVKYRQRELSDARNELAHKISTMPDSHQTSDKTSVDDTFQQSSMTLDTYETPPVDTRLISTIPNLDQKLLMLSQLTYKIFDSLTLDEISKMEISKREHLEKVKKQVRTLHMRMVSMQLDETVENCRFKTIEGLQRAKLKIKIISSQIECQLLQQLLQCNSKNLGEMIEKDTGAAVKVTYKSHNQQECSDERNESAHSIIEIRHMLRQSEQ